MSLPNIFKHCLRISDNYIPTISWITHKKFKQSASSYETKQQQRNNLPLRLPAKNLTFLNNHPAAKQAKVSEQQVTRKSQTSPLYSTEGFSFSFHSNSFTESAQNNRTHTTQHNTTTKRKPKQRLSLRLNNHILVSVECSSSVRAVNNSTTSESVKETESKSR